MVRAYDAWLAAAARAAGPGRKEFKVLSPPVSVQSVIDTAPPCTVIAGRPGIEFGPQGSVMPKPPLSVLFDTHTVPDDTSSAGVPVQTFGGPPLQWKA